MALEVRSETPIVGQGLSRASQPPSADATGPAPAAEQTADVESSPTPQNGAVDLLERRGRPRQENQLDQLATNLAEWVLQVADDMADAVIGGVSAPFAQPLSEQEKLEYYTRRMFNPDGSPNFVGRDQEIQRLGPQGFAEVLHEVLEAHPEWKRQSQAAPSGPLAPDGLPTSNPAELEQAAGGQMQSVPMPTGPVAPDGLPTRG